MIDLDYNQCSGLPLSGLGHQKVMSLHGNSKLQTKLNNLLVRKEKKTGQHVLSQRLSSCFTFLCTTARHSILFLMAPTV